MPSYPSPYIFMNSGKRFYYTRPEHNRGDNAIDINDIAAGLRQPRYTGQTVELYTIAQHAVFVAEILAEWDCDVYTQYMGLHHDDHEAFMGDLPTPFQNWLADAHGFDVLRWAKAKLDEQIMPAVGIHWPPQEGLWALVKEADYAAFMCESKQLFRQEPIWTNTVSIQREVDRTLTVMSSFKSVDLYLGTHNRLSKACDIRISREA